MANDRDGDERSDLEVLAYLYGAVQPEFIWAPGEPMPNVPAGVASPETMTLVHDLWKMDQTIPVCDDDRLQRIKAEYVRRFGREPEPTFLQSMNGVSLTLNEERAKFCFEQWQAGKSYKEINVALKRHLLWEHFEDDKSVRGPINSWAGRIKKTPRKGHRGRPAK